LVLALRDVFGGVSVSTTLLAAQSAIIGGYLLAAASVLLIGRSTLRIHTLGWLSALPLVIGLLLVMAIASPIVPVIGAEMRSITLAFGLSWVALGYALYAAGTRTAQAPQGAPTPQASAATMGAAT
jgi:hypothetical protein